MAKKVFFNVCELQEISYEFKNKLRLMDTLNEKLKRAKKIAPPDKQSVYSKLIQNCEKLTEFYLKMQETSENLSLDSEMIIRSFQNQLEDTLEENKKHFG